MIPANLFMASSLASQALYLSAINWALASGFTVFLYVESFIFFIGSITFATKAQRRKV